MIRLRPLKANDAALLAEYANDYEVFRYLRDVFPHPYNLEHAEYFINDANTKSPLQNFAITVDDKLAGVMGIHPFDDIYRHTAEIGYWIGAPHRSQGIMTQAIPLIVEYGWNTLKLRRIQASVFDDNIASMKVLERCGFVKEGILKQRLVKSGKMYDEHIYAVLGSDQKQLT